MSQFERPMALIERAPRTVQEVASATQARLSAHGFQHTAGVNLMCCSTRAALAAGARRRSSSSAEGSAASSTNGPKVRPLVVVVVVVVVGARPWVYVAAQAQKNKVQVESAVTCILFSVSSFKTGWCFQAGVELARPPPPGAGAADPPTPSLSAAAAVVVVRMFSWTVWAVAAPPRRAISSTGALSRRRRFSLTAQGVQARVLKEQGSS